MNDAVRPSSLFAAGARAGPAAGIAGTIAHPPPDAARLPAGTILRGVVVGPDHKGHVIVRTELGDLSVATKAPLVASSEVTLQVRSTGPQLHVLLMQGRVPTAPATANAVPQNPRPSVPAGGAQPAPPPLGAAAPPVDHLTIGQTVRAILQLPTPLPPDLAGVPGLDPAALRALHQLAPGAELTLRILATTTSPQAASDFAPRPGAGAEAIAGQGAGGRGGFTVAPTPAGAPTAAPPVLSAPTAPMPPPAASVPPPSAAPSASVPAPAVPQHQALPPAATAPGQVSPGPPARATAAPAPSPSAAAGALAAPSSTAPPQAGGIPPSAAAVADRSATGIASATGPSNPAAMPELAGGPRATPTASQTTQEPPRARQVAALPGAAPSPASPSPANAGVPPSGTAAFPATPASLSPTGDGGIRFAAVVAQVTPSGNPVLATPLGTLALETPMALPQGGKLTVEVPHGGWRHDLAPGSPPTAGTLTHHWPALEEALSILHELAGPGARSVPDGVAQPGPRLASGMLFVLAALSGGQIDRWLGAQPLKALQAAGKDSLAARLAQDFAQMSRLADTGAGEWRLLPIPLWDGHAVRPLRLYLRQRGEEGGGAARDDGEDATRFVLEVEMSRLGDLQLDGLVRDKRFDLIFRSREALPEAMRQSIRRIFQGANDAAGYTGQIGFQASRDWKPMPIPSGDEVAPSLIV